MQENGASSLPLSSRLTLRITPQGIAFAVPDARAIQQIRYETFTSKHGVSLAANLREALRGDGLPAEAWRKARVMIDAPVLMVPALEFSEDTVEDLYRYTMADTDGDAVLNHRLPSLNAVAVFGINRDLRTVVEDRFDDVNYLPLCAPVWRHLHHHSFTGNRRKLYAYFHERRLEVFAYRQNRFLFQNCYDARHAADAAYFLVAVWKQLAFDQERDELHIAGAPADEDELLKQLQTYLAHVDFIRAADEFDNAPLTLIEGLPYDLATLFLSR